MEAEMTIEALQKELDETKVALRKANEQLDMLAGAVSGGVARMVVDDGFRIIAASEGYYRMTGYTQEQSLEPPFLGRGINLVVKEDQPAILHVVEQILRTNEPGNASYRLLKRDGTMVSNTAYCACVEVVNGERTVDVFFIDTTQARNIERRLSALLDNLPVGVVQAEVRNEILVTYANGAFYRQLGYTPEEFAEEPLQNHYMRVVCPGDRAMLWERIQAFVEMGGSCPTLEFKVVAKDERMRSIRGQVARLNDSLEECPVIQCIFTDVTEERQRQRESNLNEERYRIISEQTRDTVYEWNLETDLIQFSPVYEKMFGFMPPPGMRMCNLLEEDIIWQEDKPVVQELMLAVHRGQPYVEAEYRAKKADGSYLWCCNRITVIFEEGRTPVRAVGVLTDVNEHKRETNTLQERAQRDSLTGLFNRMALEKGVRRNLAASTPKAHHAYLQIDIDHFKQINDFMGHVAGDAALVQLAGCLSAHVREGDLTGRMGGDEFVVFLSNVPSEQAALTRAEQLKDAIHCDFRFGEKLYPMSVSVGVAMFPAHGSEFQELYRRADAALYRAKRSGGNTVRLTAVKDVC